MQVLKFGGSSVANAANIGKVADIIKDRSRSAKTIIVVSALGGITDTLLQCSNLAALADEMEMTRVTIGVFEAESALAKVDFPRDARVDHPVQGAVNGRAADPAVLRANEIDELVGSEVSFLTKEHVHDEIAFARAAAAGGPALFDELARGRNRHDEAGLRR